MHKEEKRHKLTDVLFICKKRMTSAGVEYPGGFSSGLHNSAKFVSDMLKHNLHLTTSVVDVVDGNDVDRELTAYKPKLCIIEANWVTPDKFKELIRLHPHVKFMVRIHSEIPFLSLEGISFTWIPEYLKMGIEVGFNSARTVRDFKNLQSLDSLKELIVYTPNYYPVTKERRHTIEESNVVSIGCFGAIRPFKNQLIQAIAAINFANKNGKVLDFHINTERVEGGGNPILKNLRALFRSQGVKHLLIEHPWLSHEEFIKLVKTMDIGMQMSYNETFNIVSADFVNNNVPMVSSEEVEFVHPLFQADVNSVASITQSLEYAYKGDRLNLQYLSKRRLKDLSTDAIKVWKRLLK